MKTAAPQGAGSTRALASTLPPGQDLHIRELLYHDKDRGFLEVLAELSPTALTPEQFRLVLGRRRRQGVHTYVCILGDRVVGTASLLIEDRFSHGGGRVGHIEDVVVTRGYRRAGIGSALVRYAIRTARLLGCYKVILNCDHKVTPFYRRLGFKDWQGGMRLGLT